MHNMNTVPLLSALLRTEYESNDQLKEEINDLQVQLLTAQASIDEYKVHINALEYQIEKVKRIITPIKVIEEAPVDLEDIYDVEDIYGQNWDTSWMNE